VGAFYSQSSRLFFVCAGADRYRANSTPHLIGDAAEHPDVKLAAGTALVEIACKHW
jgi:hypothetical protein